MYMYLYIYIYRVNVLQHAYKLLRRSAAKRRTPKISKPVRSITRACTASAGAKGASPIRIGSWRTLYQSHNKEPPKKGIGNHLEFRPLHELQNRFSHQLQTLVTCGPVECPWQIQGVEGLTLHRGGGGGVWNDLGLRV